jgi:hypothetical protein
LLTTHQKYICLQEVKTGVRRSIKITDKVFNATYRCANKYIRSIQDAPEFIALSRHMYEAGESSMNNHKNLKADLDDFAA